ncbi:MAG: hypothetical protein E6G74_22600, partial [Alphaproteobacteria bacterium]
NDAALRLLPVCPEEVAAMIDDLRLARRLSGFRGGLAADRAALEAAALALGRFFLDHRARVKEIEINPLIVRSIDGSPRAAGPDPAKPGVGAIAVDVRVLWQEGVKEA